jgi:lipoyl(octanoyl) transferase
MNIEVKNSIKPVDYIDSMKILEQRVKDVSLGKKKELLWVLEHNSVYTAGTSSNNKDLIDKNLQVIKTNRGGKYTHHSPGQKIIYFVLN